MGTNRISRRGFLKRGAGLVAAPTIIPSGVLGNAYAAPASERITMASIGVGSRGTDLLNLFRDMKECQVIAVCDPFTDRRLKAQKETNEKYGMKNGCDAYNDLREMVAREDIDAVVVATPDHWHVRAALAAVRAGKDVYVEKPLGLSLEQGQILRRDVRANKRIFQYGTQQRSQEDFRAACEYVRNGRIGKLERIEVWSPQSEPGGSTAEIPVPEGFDYNLWLGPAPMKPYTADRCSRLGAFYISDYALGYIAGWGVHPLDIAQWGNGTDDTSPIHYSGTGEFPPPDSLYDTSTKWDIECTYANGVKMRYMSENLAKPIVMAYRPEWNSHGTTFFGPEGWISVDRGGVYASKPELIKGKLGADGVPLYKSDNHGKNFLECIRSRKDPICPIETAVNVDAISQLSDICLRVNRDIAFDPKTETISGDEEAAARLKREMRDPWKM